MLTLHSYHRTETGHNMSPFCLKTDIWLRHAGIDFRLEEHDDARKMPKMKMPVVQLEEEMVADSHFIELWCKEKYGIDPDAWLTPRQKATAHALRVMAEERLYWVLFWFRWAKDENWRQLKSMFFGNMPPVIRDLAAWKVRDIMLKSLIGQGLSRHSEDEIIALALEDLDAIERQLEEGPWLMGPKFSSVDAAVYGIVQNIRVPFDTPLARAVENRPKLMAWLSLVEAGPEKKAKAA